MNLQENIPIYRAKKIDSDELVIGYLVPYTYENKEWIIQSRFNCNSDYIDPTTLSIHFFDMLDSEGTKIFASLQEDGKGGDVIDDRNEQMVVKYDPIYRAIVVSDEMMFYDLNFARTKVIGIQKWIYKKT